MTVVDVRALAGTREVTAYHDGGLFPVLARAPGDAVVAVIRGGAGHMGLAGRIEVVRSLDGGRTWSPPAVVADGDRDDRNPALGVSPAGTLVLAYHRQGSYDEHGMPAMVPRDGREQPIEVMVTRSHDAGLTWEAPRPLGAGLLRDGSPFGKIAALADGTLLLPIYLRDHACAVASLEEARRRGPERYGSYVVRSCDDGRTWEEPALVARAIDETALLALPDGDVLALLRGTAEEGGLWSARSQDGGRSWSEPAPVTTAGRHPADLALLSGGDVLLTYGNRNPPYRIEGRISRDGGRTWDPRLLAFSGPLYGYGGAARRTDLGYPSTAVLSGGRGVTMYYFDPSLPASGDWRDEGPEGPLFSHRGYRAVAVSWVEAELKA